MDQFKEEPLITEVSLMISVEEIVRTVASKAKDQSRVKSQQFHLNDQGPQSSRMLAVR